MTTRGLGGSGNTWERLAQNDPLWAILSDPAKRGGGWNLDEFFATGEQEVAELMTYLDRVAPSLQREAALDFGCGIGRNARALASRFEHVTGVDISPTMIEEARKHAPQCEFLVNESTTLEAIEDNSRDFVYSCITLQHIPEPAVLLYLAEFIRVLRTGGVAVFQLPAVRRPSLKTRLSWLLPRSVRAKRYSGIEMHGIRRGTVLSSLAMAGGEVIDVQRDLTAGPEWESYRYAITKR